MWQEKLEGRGRGGKGKNNKGTMGGERADIVSLLWLPKANILRCQTNNIPFTVDDTSTGTTGPNVDTDIMVYVKVNVVSAISRCLSRALSRWSAVRHRWCYGGHGERGSDGKKKKILLSM